MNLNGKIVRLLFDLPPGARSFDAVAPVFRALEADGFTSAPVSVPNGECEMVRHRDGVESDIAYFVFGKNRCLATAALGQRAGVVADVTELRALVQDLSAQLVQALGQPRLDLDQIEAAFSEGRLDPDIVLYSMVWSRDPSTGSTRRLGSVYSFREELQALKQPVKASFGAAADSGRLEVSLLIEFN